MPSSKVMHHDALTDNLHSFTPISHLNMSLVYIFIAVFSQEPCSQDFLKLEQLVKWDAFIQLLKAGHILQNDVCIFNLL